MDFDDGPAGEAPAGRSASHEELRARVESAEPAGDSGAGPSGGGAPLSPTKATDMSTAVFTEVQQQKQETGEDPGPQDGGSIFSGSAATSFIDRMVDGSQQADSLGISINVMKMDPTENLAAALPTEAAASAGQSQAIAGKAGADLGISYEKLAEIKARTMYEMVEEIPGAADGQTRKLLFLTNSQASLLASSGTSIQKMLDALEIPKPKLIINLVMSMGFTECCEACAPWEGGADGLYAGLIHNRGAFKTKEEEHAAIALIDRFMLETIIPLAAQTNAIIITPAESNACILTRSLLKMTGLIRSKWENGVPYSVISLESCAGFYYGNNKPAAVWKTIRKHSKVWQARSDYINHLYHKAFADPETGLLQPEYWDIDINSMYLIIVDAIDPEKQEINHTAPANKLKTELMRYLGANLPAITFKTGNSWKAPLERASDPQSGIGVCMDSALKGSPLVFLDVRPRERPILGRKVKREELINYAKECFEKDCEDLRRTGVAETFDACAIAHFKDVIAGDGYWLTTETAAGMHQEAGLPIWRALELYTTPGLSKQTHRGPIESATEEQISDTASWLAKKILEEAYLMIPAAKKYKCARCTVKCKDVRSPGRPGVGRSARD